MNQLKVTQGDGGIPPEPEWEAFLEDEDRQMGASKYWREIVNEMKEAGTVSLANGHAIMRIVLFRLEFDKSSEMVLKFGRILESKKTKVPQMNLNWTCMKQAAEMLQNLEAELGLSPRRRASVSKVNRGTKKAAVAANDYIKPVA